MTELFQLHCAYPQHLADCVHDELALPVAGRPALILYAAIDGLYIEDLNDDPKRAEEWDAGDEEWITCARSAYRTLSALAGGFPVRIARRQKGWTTEPELDISRDMIVALSSFGTDPLLWTTLSIPKQVLNDLELSSVLDHAPWWIAHGYKESFLVIGTGKSIQSISLALNATVDSLPFRPHRIRAHEKGSHS